MLVSPEYFNEENISKEQYSTGGLKSFQSWSHKTDKKDGRKAYTCWRPWGYVSTQSYDKAPRIREAEKRLYLSLLGTLKSNFMQIWTDYLSAKAEEEKIDNDKWWNAYKEQKKWRKYILFVFLWCCLS